MLKCAFYEREITPPLGCNLPGYGNCRPGSDVKDRLMAKAAVFSDGENTVAMIALDLLHIYKEIRDEIAERIHKYTGIPKDNVLVAAIHSHTGIPLKDWSNPNEQEATDNQANYYDVFTKIIADCAILAYKRLQDANLSYALGNVEGISFCRDYFMKNSTPRTNPGRLNPDVIGPCNETDNELPVLMVKSASGKPLGAIVCFACHLDCVGGTDYSGDFASELSNQMKKLYGNDFVTVFFMGTAGDINHFNVNVADDAPDHYRMMGQKIAGEALRALSFAEEVKGDKIRNEYEVLTIKRLQVSEEKLAAAKHIVATVKPIPGIKVAADGTAKDQYDLMMANKLLNVLQTSPEEFEVPVHFIQIGDVKFYGFPSEIFCKFGLMIKEQCGTDKRFVATCCNGAYGYVPTEDMFYDTVYESAPGSNRMQKEAGYILVDKLLEMGR